MRDTAPDFPPAKREHNLTNPDAPIDLHAHTTASDGSDTPAELVALATRRGLAAIAITDHDTVAGAAAALRATTWGGIEVVAGVEVSARHEPGVLHILGYYVDPGDPALGTLLSRVQEDRRERNPRIIERLHALGIDISLDDARAFAGEEQIGRPHIAQALVARGAVESYSTAFERFLGKGAPAYVEKEKPTAEDAIEAIRAAGGVAALAHPYQLDIGDDDALADKVAALAGAGLGAIECHYPLHTPAMTARYLELAARYDLAPTGGSDYHGAVKPDAVLGLAPPETIPYRLLDALRNRAARGR